VGGRFTTEQLYIPEIELYLRVVESQRRSGTGGEAKELLTLPGIELRLIGSQIIILIIWGFQ
jgi:hypothetical protein